VSDDLEGDELDLGADAAPPRGAKRSSPKGERTAQRRSDAAPRSNTRLAFVGIAVLLALSSPLWGPLLMRRMSFFRVRRIEILGAHFVSPSDLLARLRVDTSASVWDPAAPLERRAAGHPAIETARIERKLPGTLVLRVTERVPVALLPANGGFRVYDARGAALPIDPTRVSVDAPVIMERDVGVLRLLGAMRLNMPAFYARVSTIRRAGTNELLFQLNTVPVRAMKDVTLERLAEIDPVEADLNRKQLRALELDLRYRDQVIARIE
jgi:cell division protein FtsQ